MNKAEMIPALAIFDLDDTLLNGDCTYFWLDWVIERGWVEDRDAMLALMHKHDGQYHAGTLDMTEHLRISLLPLIGRQQSVVRSEVEKFVESRIQPHLMQGALDQLKSHIDQGHETLVISASMHHLVEPIAHIIGADGALASKGELDQNNCFTGEPTGIQTFQKGKLLALEAWLEDHSQRFLPGFKTYGYSDSFNDLPLLEYVDYPHATQPDVRLKAHAIDKDWPIYQWR